MLESNNGNVSQIQMILDLKKYKFRTMFLPKKHAEKIAEMHLRLTPLNIHRCISRPIFDKNETDS